MHYIVKYGDYYVDEFCNYWTLQSRAARFPTREEAAIFTQLLDLDARVVKLRERRN